MNVCNDDGVDVGGIDTRSGKALRQATERRRKDVRRAGVHEDQLVPGIDEPFVDGCVLDVGRLICGLQ